MSLERGHHNDNGGLGLHYTSDNRNNNVNECVVSMRRSILLLLEVHVNVEFKLSINYTNHDKTAKNKNNNNYNKILS